MRATEDRAGTRMIHPVHVCTTKLQGILLRIGILKAFCHQDVPTFQWHEAIRVCERVCLY